MSTEHCALIINQVNQNKLDIWLLSHKMLWSYACAVHLPLTHGDQVIPVYLGRFHGCWCPGCFCHQAISSHDIDYANWVGPCLTRGRISTTCVMSMWRNHRKCEYMFLLKNLARKELRTTQVRHYTSLEPVTGDGPIPCVLAIAEHLIMASTTSLHALILQGKSL